jgi:hypothetical protein
LKKRSHLLNLDLKEVMLKWKLKLFKEGRDGIHLAQEETSRFFCEENNVPSGLSSQVRISDSTGLIHEVS